ncbi:MAG: ABC-F type ribosomal protection protein [Lachnospiraceae bacterium]|nr:ABC-F type ribosomal protection protein [Lachnospiraceae bacterium]
MAQINVNNLTFYYEGSFDNIFENVSFSIDTDWKLGFVGRNGKGKTTFLNLLMGKYEYKGSITASTTFDYFPYRLKEDDLKKPAAEFLEELKPGVETWRVICELDKMNVDAQVLYRPFSTLSFGERTKVLLAVLFSGENEFLLIDEPTNHLDYASREIVKAYLREKKGFILVSHDRDFLDACIDHVLVLNRSSIEVCNGNFTSWWENKEKSDHFARMENEKHTKEITKLEAAADRARRWAEKGENSKIGYDPVKFPDRAANYRAYVGAKTKKMQSRVKQMEFRIENEIREKEGLLKDIEEPVDLKIMPLKHHKEVLAFAYDYSLRYRDADEELFRDLRFEIKQGQRIFLSGENGCGKSTLIKMILQKASFHGGDDELSVIETGSLSVASGLVISYINQDTSYLKGSIQEFCEKQGLSLSLFCAILRQLDMERVQFVKKMEDFSEGQKKKVLIAASLLTPAHLYIWDEPLNYIDVFSRMQIEKLINSFKPTMLIVDHDVRFQEKIATEVITISKKQG